MAGVGSASNFKAKKQQLYSIKQVSLRLNCSISTVRRLIRDGELTACKVRGSIRIPEANLNRFIQNAIYDFQVNNGEAKF